MDKIGICMLTGAFYPEISGGGIQARTLSYALKKQYNFYVLTTCKDFSLPAQETIQGITINRIMLRPNSLTSKVNSFFQFLRVFFKIRKRIDILHLHGFSEKTILFILLGKIFRKKIIQKMTSAGDDDPVSISKQRFGKIKTLFLLKADVFVSVSPALTQKFNRASLIKLKRKLITIPNAVDTKIFRPLKDLAEKIALRRELGMPEKNKIIIFVGFFSLDKGAGLLMDVWKKVRVREKGVSILFIGSTDTTYFEINASLIEKIRNEIDRYKMRDEIFFVEKTLEIEKYYQASDIFVLPSKREGLPNSLLEAMSSGLACIATRLDGITDYIIDDEEDGLLFEKNNTEELQKKLLSLLHNERFANELGRNARGKIMGKFSINDIAPKYFQLYKNLAFGNNHA